jgi:hypothetical protein
VLTRQPRFERPEEPVDVVANQDFGDALRALGMVRLDALTGRLTVV